MYNQTIYFRLQTISPIHVGCGEVFEPTSFVLDETTKEMISFDPATLLEQLDDEALRKFSAICRKGTPASLIEVYNFINHYKDLVDGDRVTVSNSFIDHYQRTLQLKGNRIDKELNQFQVARTAFNIHDGRPYIPGSAIKGALRTAVLNARNGGRDKPRPGDAKELETNLAGGVFQDDPFRLVKVSDFMPLGNVSRSIVYAANRKKKPSEREAQALYQIFEVIEPAMDFFGSITVLDSEQTGLRKPVTLVEIDQALHRFYEEEMKREREEAFFIGCDTYPQKLEATTLLRLGRHSGAECLTVKGVRNIRIMQARNTPPKFSDHSTTLWLAAHTPKPTTNRGLQPFGWVACHLLSEKEAKDCSLQKQQEHQNRQNHQQEKLLACRQKAELSRLQALADKQKQKQQEEEQHRQQEEDRKYPWRHMLAVVATVTDWGSLRQRVLDNDILKEYQAELEVGAVVKTAAERVRDSNRRKWEIERDHILADWLKPSGIAWQGRTDQPGPSRTLSLADQEQTERIEKLADWSQFKDSDIVIAQLCRPAAEKLKKLFVEQKWDNKKAKDQDKPKAWRELQAHLRKIG